MATLLTTARFESPDWHQQAGEHNQVVCYFSGMTLFTSLTGIINTSSTYLVRGL